MNLAAMAAGRTIGSLIGPRLWERAGLIGNTTVAAIMMVLAALVLARWLREGVEEVHE